MARKVIPGPAGKVDFGRQPPPHVRGRLDFRVRPVLPDVVLSAATDEPAYVAKVGASFTYKCLKKDSKGKDISSATAAQLASLPSWAWDGSCVIPCFESVITSASPEWITLADSTGEVSAAFSPDAYQRFAHLLLPGASLRLLDATLAGGHRMRQLWETSAPTFLVVNVDNVSVIYHE